MTTPSTRALGTAGGKLPPETSQLWLLIGGLLCRPSHVSPAGQWQQGGSAAQGHRVHHLLQLAAEPLPPGLLVLLQGRQDLRRRVEVLVAWPGRCSLVVLESLEECTQWAQDVAVAGADTQFLPFSAEGPGFLAWTPRTPV